MYSRLSTSRIRARKLARRLPDSHRITRRLKRKKTPTIIDSRGIGGLSYPLYIIKRRPEFNTYGIPVRGYFHGRSHPGGVQYKGASRPITWKDS